METLVIAVMALLAFVIVLLPLLRRGPSTSSDAREFATGDDEAVTAERASAVTAAVPSELPVAAALTDDSGIEREVLRYRAALRAGTLCPRCGEANPADSLFCADCGKKLPRSDAKEFE